MLSSFVWSGPSVASGKQELQILRFFGFSLDACKMYKLDAFSDFSYDTSASHVFFCGLGGWGAYDFFQSLSC